MSYGPAICCLLLNEAAADIPEEFIKLRRFLRDGQTQRVYTDTALVGTTKGSR